MDPTLKNKTITKLKEDLAGFSPRLRIVAKYIVDHSSDFGLDSIRETARKAGVSTYTLVRMAERLGFEGYDELREPFRHALVSASAVVDQPDWVGNLRESGEFGQVQADAGMNTVAIVQRSLERQTPEQMERVAGMLLEANNVYLSAVRASYALAYYLHYVGRMALPSLQLIPRHMNSAIDELNYAGEGDVMIAITFSPYSRETIEACKFARDKGVKLIMISDSDIISKDFRAEETLIASTVSTHHFGCYTGAMAVIENLLALLVKQGGDAAMRRIKSYEDLRKDNNAYWIAQKKH
ncbi:MurR/RpiR family transcriptional regulator [Shimia thalassica]|nr:MurR/RpiR family transcriptional regulator [Shimia thalassica]PHO05613.1 iron dicitrate transport regulator FecR [Rhodobacteraceae bacterium 4F10]MBU2944912.1 MurR/RpiR family transcriptional regulator [Shimia thalassica]MDO6481115.1 MurR/RpiR family transcriptional regulator [Shimia thalassica]MDO6484977.1 MurR/RpiR family transcriptional regulator [Shimia thalassica]MDO6504782.1 MurR/RpiR family transcriptional regulator [Shimia thalassica]